MPLSRLQSLTQLCGMELPSARSLEIRLTVKRDSEISIKGSYVGNRQDTAEAIEFFRQGFIKAPYKYVSLNSKIATLLTRCTESLAYRNYKRCTI